jgi:ABC-2 type transport system ATP-binding protein
MDQTDARMRIGEVLERVGVTDRARQQVGRLSRGLRQRVGLAVALLPEPDVLILDEPTSGLDPIQRIEVRKLIRELAAEHTVVVSSHILAEIEMICPRVVVMSQGRVVADGTGDELVTSFAGSGHVALEAVVPDPAEAERLLAALPGVTRVEVGERVGIHTGFRIEGEGDLREDVGALAMTKGWALRELSWQQPSLEDLFAKLVMGEGGVAALTSKTAPSTAPAAPSAPGPPAAPQLEVALPVSAPEPSPAPAADAGPPKMIYSLNPFDRGAERDLGKPVSADPTAPATPEERCEDEEDDA